MKKYILAIFLTAMFATSTMIAQSLEFVRSDETSSGQLGDEFVTYANFKNLTNENLVITVKIEALKMHTGHVLLPCFNEYCYEFNPPVQIYFEDYQLIHLGAGETTSIANGKEFSVHLEPNGWEGITIARFTFMVSEDDFISYECTFNVGGTSVLEQSNKAKVLLYPNPVTDFVNISIDDVSDFSDYNVEFYNSAGLKLDNNNQQWNSSLISFNTLNLPSATYYYVISRRDNIIAKGSFKVVR